MPTVVSEITSGAQYTKAQTDQQDSATRVFRVVLSSPGEVIDPQRACNVLIGSAHPNYPSLLCASADIRYDGESRMAVLCTFQYQGANSQANTGQPPGTEPANWSLTSSLIESPVYSWRRRTAVANWEAQFSPAVNSAGDIYDAITQLNGIINWTVTQTQIGSDPYVHLKRTGAVNSKAIQLGTLLMDEHTVMFRGLQAQPYVADWRGQEYRGWRCTYEFAYKPNRTTISFPNGVELPVDLGWDIAVPQTGFNVKMFAPANPAADQDPFGQPLRHEDGKIVRNMAGQLSLPVGSNPGERARAMVKVFSYEDGGESQAPSASPIPLNDDGTPRAEAANPKVLVYGYSVQEEVDFIQEFGIRLQ